MQLDLPERTGCDTRTRARAWGIPGPFVQTRALEGVRVDSELRCLLRKLPY